MGWIEDVREAMKEVVPEIPIAKFKVTGDKVGQSIRKKNWSWPRSNCEFLVEKK